MHLTGTLFLAFMVVLTVALFAATVWLTGRLRTGLAQAAARAALIGATCLSLLLSVGVKLNNDNGWYTSWADLLGQRSAVASDVVGARSVQTERTDQKATPVADLPEVPRPGKREQAYTWTGPASGFEGKIEVVLPASYFDPASKDRRYPVIEALHGIPGSLYGWLEKLEITKVTDQAVAAHQMGEAIIVVPQITPTASQDNECVDSSMGKAETWLTKDIPSFVRSHLRAATEPASWAAIGYSAGGWCANMAAVLHPDVYGAAISLGGYFKPMFDGPAPFTADSAQARRYDLAAVVKHNPPKVALWEQTGRQSEFWPQTDRFFKAVKAPTSLTSVVLANSGHRWEIWQQQLPSSLKWLGATLPGFRA